MSDAIKKISSRMLALDLLRGYFIVVIIIDHIWRWPSLFGFISGKASLWVTAGEGFVIISGLLIGYVRGYKNRELPIMDVSKKIWRRALTLYLWLVGISIFYTALAWYGHFAAPTAWVDIPSGDWPRLIVETILMGYRHEWIYFLYFYTLLLAIAPVAIYLLRRNMILQAVLFTFIGYLIGRVYSIEWLQWMPMFFLPTIAGYYLPMIQRLWGGLVKRRRIVLLSLLYAFFGTTFVGSIITIFILPSDPTSIFLNSIITKQDFFPLARIPIALLWFTAFAMLFHHFRFFINRFLGWLLLPFGTRSLTAYIAHGSLIFLLAFAAPLTDNIWYNTGLGIIAILGTWYLVTRKSVQKVIPQ